MVSLKNGNDQVASLATDFKQSKIKWAHTHSQKTPIWMVFWRGCNPFETIQAVFAR
jgi:hypothetical protein